MATGWILCLVLLNQTATAKSDGWQPGGTTDAASLAVSSQANPDSSAIAQTQFTQPAYTGGAATGPQFQSPRFTPQAGGASQATVPMPATQRAWQLQQARLQAAQQQLAAQQQQTIQQQQIAQQQQQQTVQPQLANQNATSQFNTANPSQRSGSQFGTQLQNPATPQVPAWPHNSGQTTDANGRQNAGFNLRFADSRFNTTGQTSQPQTAGQLNTQTAGQLNTQTAGQPQTSGQLNTSRQAFNGSGSQPWQPHQRSGNPNNWQHQQTTQTQTAPTLLAPQNSQLGNHAFQQQRATTSGQTQGSQFGTSHTQLGTGNTRFGTGNTQLGNQQGQPSQSFQNQPRNGQANQGSWAGGSQPNTHFQHQANVSDARIASAVNSQGSQPALQPAQQQPASQFGTSVLVTNNRQPSSLQPPLQATLPNESGRNAEAGTNRFSPYDNVQPARVDAGGDNARLTVDDSHWNQDPNNNVTLSERGQGQQANHDQSHRHNDSQGQAHNHTQNQQAKAADRLSSSGPSNGVASGNLATSPRGYGAGSSAGNGLGLLASVGVGREPAPSVNANNGQSSTSSDDKPWLPLMLTMLGLFASAAGNLYLGWIAFESHFRYRRLLVEGDDFDDRGTRRSRD